MGSLFDVMVSYLRGKGKLPAVHPECTLNTLDQSLFFISYLIGMKWNFVASFSFYFSSYSLAIFMDNSCYLSSVVSEKKIMGNHSALMNLNENNVESLNREIYGKMYYKLFRKPL